MRHGKKMFMLLSLPFLLSSCHPGAATASGKTTASFGETAERRTDKTDRTTSTPHASKDDHPSMTTSARKNGQPYSLTVPEKKGYRFLGFYVDGQRIPTSGTWYYGEKEPEAKFEPIAYQITYLLPSDAMNNPENPTSYTVEDPTIVLKAPSREGYTFMGWYDTEGNKVSELDTTKAADIRIFSTWNIDGTQVRKIELTDSADQKIDHDVDMKVTESIRIYGKATLTGGGSISAARFRWESSDETVATVTKGSIHGVKAGEADITASYGEGKSEKSVVLHVKVNPYQLNKEQRDSALSQILYTEAGVHDYFNKEEPAPSARLIAWNVKENAGTAEEKETSYKEYEKGKRILEKKSTTTTLYTEYWPSDDIRYQWEKGKTKSCVQLEADHTQGQYCYYTAATGSLMGECFLKSREENNDLSMSFDGEKYTVSYTDDSREVKVDFTTDSDFGNVTATNTYSQDRDLIKLKSVSKTVTDNSGTESITKKTIVSGLVYGATGYTLSASLEQENTLATGYLFTTQKVDTVKLKVEDTVLKEDEEMVLSLNHGQTYTLLYCDQTDSQDPSKYNEVSEYSYTDLDTQEEKKIKMLTNENATWASSDPSVVSVDTKGNLTAGKEGTATITADFQGHQVSGKVNVVNDYDPNQFGRYPQTHVNDSDLVTSLESLSATNAQGYYEYDSDSDGVKEEYAKLKATPFEENTAFSDGTTIVNGTSYWFKVEPIEWIKLKDSLNEETLLTKKLLVSMPYRAEDTNNDSRYDTSDLRNFLAATEAKADEKACILAGFDAKEETVIEHNEFTIKYYQFGDTSGYGPTGKATLNDALFSLTKDEVDSWLDKESEKSKEFQENIKKAPFTDYALAMGGNKNADGDGSYWLDAKLGESHGNPDNYNCNYLDKDAGTAKYARANTTGYGVRPLVHVKAGGKPIT